MSVTRLDLGGTWRLGWFDGRRGDRAFRDEGPGGQADWLEATVPGELHADLERQGAIPPVNEGLGILSSRWIEDCTWYFVREFDVDEPLGGRIAELVLERLELDAAVYLNGELVATHRNAFRPLRVDVTSRLRAGANTIRVELDGGLQATRDLPSTGYRHKTEQGLTKRHWLRSGQSQFSWDWSPRLVTIGITEPAGIEFRETPARIESVVPIVGLSDDHGLATVTCRVHLVAAEGAVVSATIASRTVSATATDDLVELQLEVENPELWWPVGMGDPVLHELTVSLSSGGRVVDERELSIGLRSIVVDQSPTPDGGRLFRLMVNGRRFFAKGANWVPLSLAPHPVDTGLLELQLDRALEANFNFLRVWGGGDYETEQFYAGCDSRGILVWQDFIFACSRYPLSDADFHDEVVTEATYQVRRLASHPSLAVWAGNNEIAWIGISPGWPGPLVLAEDGVTHEQMLADHAFFEGELGELVAREDGTRFYQPSSPWSPEGDDHNDFHQGDQHPWQVGFDTVDFLDYRQMDARFPNEGGLLGPPSLLSIRESLAAGEQGRGSLAWKLHENEVAHSYANRPMDSLLATWTGVDAARASPEEYAYWAGLVQGEALREYVDNFRRRADTTGAAVFWMYNDCWPTVRSWSIVDWQGRRNPAFAAVKRAFAPVRVVIEPEDDGAVVIVCSDEQVDLEFELEFGTAGLAGGMATRRETVVARAAAATIVGHLAALPPDSAFVAILRRGDEIISSNRLLAGQFASLAWSEPALEVTHGPGWSTYRSAVLVLGVCLDLDGVRDLDDNFFDLLPGVEHTVHWGGDEPPAVLFTGNEAGRR